MSIMVFNDPTCRNQNCSGYKEDNRVVHSMISSEVLAARMSKDTIDCLATDMNSIGDPKSPPRPGSVLPTIRTKRDICGKCGEVYTISIETGFVRIPITTLAGHQPTLEFY